MRDRIASRYELRERLGGSATATVWRARDKRRRLDVALKVATDPVADVASRRQLAAEADATGRLNHPNIVPLLDAHLGRKEAALAFTFVGGETLARRLSRSMRMHPAEAVAYGADIADALAHAHGRGVVHRDVKPGNVMIGPDGRARLFDFGIASTTQRADGGLPAPGMTSGTLPYMAPEQLAGQPADPATDVYALGAVLYEMLAGRRPYIASTTAELARQQRLPVPPVTDAPADLVELAIAALSFDSRLRPTAPAMAHRLRMWQAGQAEAQTVFVPAIPPTAVVPAVAAPPVRAPARPSALALIAGALVIVGIVAGSIALANGLGQPARTPGPTTAPSFAGDQPSLTPAAPPVAPAAGGGGGGGSGGDNGNHGGSNKGGQGHGHGHGDGNGPGN
jgi:eukaryotic-like serine/threonine-protein kinase